MLSYPSDVRRKAQCLQTTENCTHTGKLTSLSSIPPLMCHRGTPRSDESASTILNYRLFPADGQTIFKTGPETKVELTGVTNYVTSGGFASSASENKGWFFGGMRAASWGPLAQSARTDGSDARAITNLSDAFITADIHLPGAASWTNTSLPDTVRSRVNPELVWVPVSKQGILLAIGGVAHHFKYNNFALSKEQIVESEFLSPSFMEQITIYDVESDKWLLQNTTGDLPLFRAEFCSVVVADPDDKQSYDIVIYGGDNGLSGSAAEYADDSVWILSVPAFVWTKVNSGNANHGRSGHACALPFPNQMLVIGGQNLNSTNFCIQDGSVADVFNLNTHEWTRKYSWDTYESYKRPKVVSDAISSAAGADDEVKALFDTTYITPQKVWYPYAAPGSYGTNSTTNNNGTTIISSSSPPAGAIVGGVVGGIAIIVIGSLIFWFCRPSRRRARSQRHSTSMTEVTQDSSAVGRWLKRTNFNLPPAKQIDVTEGSVTDTSADDPIVPNTHARPATGTLRDIPAEAPGDTRFRSEMSSNEDVINSPRSSAVMSGTTIGERTRHASIEAGSSEIHEMLDESTISPRHSGQSPYTPGRPYMWGRRSTFEGVLEEGPGHHHPYSATSNEHPGRLSMSENAYPTSASHASELGGMSRPSADISNQSLGRRPTIERNRSSSISRGGFDTANASPFPQPSPTPSANFVPTVPMSAISPGPVSPLLTPHGENRQMASAGGILAAASAATSGHSSASELALASGSRPKAQRHGSSMVSALSEQERNTLSSTVPLPTQAGAGAGGAGIGGVLAAQVEEDRRATERILGGMRDEGGVVSSPLPVEEKDSGERPKFKRVGSLGGRFREDVSSDGVRDGEGRTV